MTSPRKERQKSDTQWDWKCLIELSMEAPQRRGIMNKVREKRTSEPRRQWKDRLLLRMRPAWCVQETDQSPVRLDQREQRESAGDVRQWWEDRECGVWEGIGGVWGFAENGIETSGGFALEYLLNSWIAMSTTFYREQGSLGLIQIVLHLFLKPKNTLIFIALIT